MEHKKPRPAGWCPDRAGFGISLGGGNEVNPTQNALRAQAQQRLRRQQLVKVLHELGARTTSEFITELAERFGPYVDQRLAEYVNRLTPEMLRVTGGNRFPQGPMRRVGDSR